MTHEEKAREIVEKFVDSGHIYDEEFEKVERAISQALAASEKKGRKEGSLSHTMTYHQGKKEGWNEAISAAVKVIDSVHEFETMDIDEPVLVGKKEIASKIEALRKG